MSEASTMGAAAGRRERREAGERADVVDVAIVGSGFSGLGMGIQLKLAGRDDFVILEKADGVGGTWRENRYPGCACDVPSHLYSFSFEQNPDWTRAFAPQPEILAYLERCADKYGLLPHLRFGAEVVRAVFDEDAANGTGCWRVALRDGRRGHRELWARHLVMGVGALHRPAIPRFADAERFRGRAFHSAEWPADVDLDGKRVAVIGTGASAIQIVPQLAPRVARLHLYQRTPPWVLPRPDRAMSRIERRLFRALPPLQRLYRYGIYALMELRAYGFTVDPRVLRLAALLGRRHLRRQIADEALREKLTPHYLPGCKRILMANDYYPALTRPHVEVVSEPIVRFTERGIVSTTEHGREPRGEVEREVDAIIYGTGFQVTEMFTHLEVRGRGGVELNELWRREGIEAYLGTTVAGFPNLYLLMGPNTGLGHNSMVFMIEAQVRYVLSCIRAQEQRGARWADVLPAVQRGYNESLVPRLARSVWASGCHSWYLDGRGRNPTAWPGFTVEYWWRTRRVRPEDYEFGSSRSASEPAYTSTSASAPSRSARGGVP